MTTATAAAAPQVASKFNPWREQAFIASVIMDTTWLALLYQAMSPATASDPTGRVFIVFLAISILALYWGKAQIALRLHRRLNWGITGAFMLIAWVAASASLLQKAADTQFSAFETSLRGLGEVTQLLPGEVWLFFALLWMVFRGITFGRQGVGTFAVLRHLKTGFSMWLTYAVWAWLIYSGITYGPARDLPGLEYFILFLFATLMALASARVAVLGRFRGGRRHEFSRNWLGSITGVNLATVGLGLTIAMLMTGRLFTFIQGLFIYALYGIVGLVAGPFLFIVGLFSGVAVEQIEGPPQPPELPPWEQGPGFGPDQLELVNRTDLLPEEVRTAVYVVAVVLAIIAAVLFFLGLRWLYVEYISGESVEYVMKPGDWLEHFKRQLQDRRNEAETNISSRLGQRQRVMAAARIRQIYQHLMDLAEEMDIPRPAAATPLEFLKTLQRTLSAGKNELTVITNAYLKVRYGELPETREEIVAVEKAWSRLESLSRPVVEQVRSRKKEEEKERKRVEKLQ